MVVLHPQPIVAPYNRGAARGAAGWDAGSSFAGFLLLGFGGEEPVAVSGGGGGEGSEGLGGCDLGEEGP